MIDIPMPQTAPAKRKPIYTQLYFQVIVAIVAGGLLGHFYPSVGESMRPLGDAFIKLVKMIIAPVIFLTIATGIAGMRDLSKVGSVAAKAFSYFLFFSTLALVVGLVVANVVRPGDGMNIDPVSLNVGAVADYASKAQDQSIVAFLMNVIPATVVGAFADGDILQVLFFSIPFGIALAMVGDRAQPVIDVLESAAEAFFKLVGMFMRAAPIGAFGAFAFTIGRYGIDSIGNLLVLIATFYLTAALFIFVVLGVVARLNGFSIIALIRYLKEECLLVLGTSSSEAALPSLIDKMERAGCPKPIVGLVVPTGYSFNLDGTNIYMTLATLFLAQATGVHLDIWQIMSLLGVAMITSKGASGVTGAGFITLAATLAVVPDIPIQSLALLVGIDRFMSECRALTNLIGNGVATLAVARWENELDMDQLKTELARGPTQAEVARDHEEMLDEVEALDRADID